MRADKFVELKPQKFPTFLLEFLNAQPQNQLKNELRHPSKLCCPRKNDCSV